MCLILAGCTQKASEQPTSKVNNLEINNANKTITKKTVTKLMDFFALANQTPDQIEKLFGKPFSSEKKFIALSKEGIFNIYNKDGKRFLQVDFYKNKAVGFYLEIPEQLRSASAEDTLKMCGLDLQISDAKAENSGLTGYVWDNPPKASPFYIVRLSYFEDSKLYWNCETHIKIE